MDDPELFTLSGPLEINEAGRLHVSLLEFINASPAPVLDLHSIEACDAVGLQLLLSAGKSAAAAGKTLYFKEIPAIVLKTWSQLGLPVDFLTAATS